jgi:hypothetical protein
MSTEIIAKKAGIKKSIIDRFINIFTNHHLNTKLREAYTYASITDDMQARARYQVGNMRKPAKYGVHSRLVVSPDSNGQTVFYTNRNSTSLTYDRKDATLFNLSTVAGQRKALIAIRIMRKAGYDMAGLVLPKYMQRKYKVFCRAKGLPTTYAYDTHTYNANPKYAGEFYDTTDAEDMLKANFGNLDNFEIHYI